MNQKCPKEPTVLPQNHDSSCGESRQQRSHMRWFGSWQRCFLGHIPCSQNENLWQWFAPHQRPLLASDGPTYWAALARQSPSHGNPWLPTLLQGTLAHPGTPRHTLTHPDIPWHTLKNVCGHGSPCHLPWLVQNTATLAWRFWLYGQQHSTTEQGFTIALPRGSRSFGAPCSVVWLSFCVSITIINKNCLHLNFLFLMG